MTKKMATYKEIQAYVKKEHGICVRTCWIADIKEKRGLPVRRAWNRHREGRDNPCPEDKSDFIEEAMDHFGM
jgi:hypothetical protein